MWALHGLEEALRRQKKTAEAETIEQQFKAASSRADVAIDRSCFCRVGAEGEECCEKVE
ncbi:MAG: hypothetical protein ABGZ35_32760 [Planctomycetaceae bacterium]|jgi:hypothetical protein